MRRKPKPEVQEKLDNLKIQLCHDFKKLMRRQKWSQIDAAILLRTSRARIHDVENLKIENLTISQLFKYIATLAPDFKLLVSF